MRPSSHRRPRAPRQGAVSPGWDDARPARSAYIGATMDVRIARGIATANHIDQRSRSGELMLEHLARVAAAAPDDAAPAAWLHDVLEHSDVDPGDLRAQGLS